MSISAIEATGLGKRYEIGGQQEAYRTLRETLVETVGQPLKALRAKFRKDYTQDNFVWALRNVSFEVKRGEVVGIIGRNGGGKSTLLKMLSRITEPTEGYADINGRVGSLLEVGTGFHPELTGRENVLLNGAIIGMTRTEILSRFDEIVEFAEIGKFIDTPVKRYSSGMYLRLAFAVAAHLNPEILLMDEVLAVGDASFQKKCLGKMGAVAQEGRTVFFVSHNLNAIRELCTRVMWVDGGVRMDGDVSDVTHAYLRSLVSQSFSSRNEAAGLSITGVDLLNERGEKSHRFAPGDELVVQVSFEADRPIEKPYIILVIESAIGRCFTANMLMDGCRPEVMSGSGTLSCRFRSLPLLPQSYSVKMAIRAADGRQHLLNLEDVASFEVEGHLEDYGMSGEFYAVAARSTPVVIPYEWQLPDGIIKPIALTRSSELAYVNTR